MIFRTHWSEYEEARAGLAECVKFDHFQPYPVLQEKTKLPVAQFKWTVAVSKNRVLLISSNQILNFELAKPVHEFEGVLKTAVEVY